MDVKLHSIVKSNRGSTSAIIVLVTIVIIVLSALITDIGYAALEHYKLDKCARDAAELGTMLLCENRADADDLIRKYAVRIISDLNKLEINIADNKKEVTVSMGRPMEYIFLKLVGAGEKQIFADATARLSPVHTINGIRPFAIEDGSFTPGMRCTLTSADAMGKDTVRFVALNLGEGGFEDNIAFGYSRAVTAGDGVFPLDKPGADALNINDNMLDGNPKVIILPVVEKFAVSGQKPMTVAGFAAFKVEGINEENGQILVTGEFTKYVVDSDSSDSTNDYGLLSSKLLR